MNAGHAHVKTSPASLGPLTKMKNARKKLIPKIEDDVALDDHVMSLWRLRGWN